MDVAAVDQDDDSDDDMPSCAMKLATYTESIAGQPFDPDNHQTFSRQHGRPYDSDWRTRVGIC